MNLVTTTFLVLTLAASAYADSFELKQATFVSSDGVSTDSLYNYASAVPVSRYCTGGRFYVSEIYTDNVLNTEAFGNIERVLFVGDVPADYIGTFTGVEKITYGGADPPEIAAALSHEWIKTDEIVLTVYDPEPTTEQMLALKCAAEHAAFINAPLMYVTEDCVPGCTLLAGTGLGAESVYLYDFGGNVDGRTKDTLTRAGFGVKAEFGEYEEARLYREDILTAPAADFPAGVVDL
jgi:hypothetical protein